MVTTRKIKAPAEATEKPDKKRVLKEETEEKITVKKAKKSTAYVPHDPSLPNNMTFPAKFTIPAKPEGSIKIASYNVAGMNACVKKGFNAYVDAEDADILCVQETKLSAPLSTAVSDKVYKYRYWSFDEKKGYGKLLWLIVFLLIYTSGCCYFLKDKTGKNHLRPSWLGIHHTRQNDLIDISSIHIDRLLRSQCRR
jgi:hypothetical protein